MDSHEIKQKRRYEYWEKNIEGFSGFYDSCSEENIKGNWLFKYLYSKFIFPIEQNVTRRRYDMVIERLGKNVSKKNTIADVGCGGGIFSLFLAKIGTNVLAFDYADSALQLTRKRVVGSWAKNVTLKKLDITINKIPKVDFAIAIGVLPYISDLENFIINLGENSDQVMFNYLENSNGFNIVRRMLPFLNVRHYE